MLPMHSFHDDNNRPLLRLQLNWPLLLPNPYLTLLHLFALICRKKSSVNPVDLLYHNFFLPYYYYNMYRGEKNVPYLLHPYS